MQPQEPIPSDIKTLADWIYQQFGATEPVEIQNILPERYFFKYCVGEEIATPDPVTKQVLDRKYEEMWFEPGESKVLMGGAAYIFVDGVARQYVFQKHGADATGDLSILIQAAKLAIIGKVGYGQKTMETPTQPIKNEQPPVAIKTEQPVVNTTPPPETGTDEQDDAFGNMGADDRFKVIPATESEDGEAHFFIDGKEVSNSKYNEAFNAANND